MIATIRGEVDGLLRAFARRLGTRNPKLGVVANSDVDDPSTMALSEAESAYVAHFRAQVKQFGWVVSKAPDDWYEGMETASANGRCLAWADVCVDDCVLLTVGAYFDGVTTTVGSLDSQTFDLRREDSRLSTTTFSGTLKEQAALAACWIDDVLRRGIRRREWSNTAKEYSFADDGTQLVHSGSRQDRAGRPTRDTVIAGQAPGRD